MTVFETVAFNHSATCPCFYPPHLAGHKQCYQISRALSSTFSVVSLSVVSFSVRQGSKIVDEQSASAPTTGKTDNRKTENMLYATAFMRSLRAVCFSSIHRKRRGSNPISSRFLVGAPNIMIKARRGRSEWLGAVKCNVRLG